eukprot:Protomagalhaensia_wolfi_Nauph_80__6349@NODE_997_length_1824_cov_7_094678_g754_i0_p1_GENE_NODE_997_length_1824_cov_7_094678_g754_i0NODE_997_length_1824_cov_7_094678_g754_i0_p1_ORF_typecomplete_len440_score97_30Mucin15/PF15672_5/0_012BAT2_N/PF07001_11/0_016Hamartin/PF04388_12/0_04EVI2A/PF05399_11/0_59MSP1_C/PF07462_11/2_6_NODE_997_length_1824_cov_7_094678_g754_i04661785
MKFLLPVILFVTMGYGDDYVCPNTTLEVFVMEDGSLRGRYLGIFDEAIAMLNNYFPSLLVGRGLVGDKIYNQGYECYCHDWDLAIPVGDEFRSSTLKDCKGGTDLENNSMEALGYVSGSAAGFSPNALKLITYIAEQRGKAYETENNGATPSQYPNPDLATHMYCPAYKGDAMRRSFAPIQQIVELIDAADVRPVILSPSHSTMHDFWVDMMYNKMGYAGYAYVERMSADLEEFKNRYVEIILELYCVWETTSTTTTTETTTTETTTTEPTTTETTTTETTTITTTETTTPTASTETSTETTITSTETTTETTPTSTSEGTTTPTTTVTDIDTKSITTDLLPPVETTFEMVEPTDGPHESTQIIEELETTTDEESSSGVGAIVSAVSGASAGLAVLGAAAYRKWWSKPSPPESDIQDSVIQEFAAANREQVFDPQGSYI